MLPYKANIVKYHYGQDRSLNTISMVSLGVPLNRVVFPTSLIFSNIDSICVRQTDRQTDLSDPQT